MLVSFAELHIRHFVAGVLITASIADMFGEFSGVEVLITGAFGQDGQMINKVCRNMGFRTAGVIKSADPRSSSSVLLTRLAKEYSQSTIFEIDPLKKEDFQECLKKFKPKIVFHAAAVHGPSLKMDKIEESQSVEMKFVNYEMTKILLDWVTWNQENRLVVLSTSKMYNGYVSNIEIDMSTPINPRGQYAVTKALGYEALIEAQLNGRATAAILFPHTSSLVQKPFLLQEIYQKFLSCRENNTNTLTLKNLNTCIDISHAYDVCRELVRIAIEEQIEKVFYGSGNPIPLRQIVEKFARLLDFNQYRAESESNDFIPFQYLAKKELLNIKLKREFPHIEGIIEDICGITTLKFEG